MEEPFEISVTSVVNFLESKGGRCTNPELVSHFRKLLNDTVRQAEFRLQFKDIVNTVANVHEENGRKYISLKRKYYANPADEYLPNQSADEQVRFSESPQQYHSSYQPYWRYRLSCNASMLPPVSLPPTVLTRMSSQEENQSLPVAPPRHVSRRRSMQDLEFKKDTTPYENCITPMRHRSKSLYQIEANVDQDKVVHKKWLATERHRLEDMGTQHESCGTQSLPEAVNTCDNSKLTPANFEPKSPCSSVSHYMRNKSPNKRPTPVCLSDEKVDLLLSDNHTTNQQLENSPHSDSHSSVGDQTDFVIAMSTPSSPSSSLSSPETRHQSIRRSIVDYDDDNQSRRFSNNDSDVTPQHPEKEVLQIDLQPESQEVRTHSGSVRELAQMIESAAAAATNGIVPYKKSSPRSRHNRTEKVISDDNASIVSLDSKLRRQWFLKAAKADYHGLVSLLKKEPRLAGIRDIASGFTALHWAAKHGNAEVVKLIAGAHKVSPNLKSNGGYTCIHLATLYKHKAIVDLLLKTYGANPTIRDNSGKRADQYPENYVSFTVGITRKPPMPAAVTAASASTMDHIEIPNGKRILVRPADEPSPSTFIRIGSLNLKVSRTRGVFASVRGSSVRLKTWSSADSVSETWSPSDPSEKILVPKKKKSKKKRIDLASSESGNSKHDSDSDSAYGFRS